MKEIKINNVEYSIVTPGTKKSEQLIASYDYFTQNGTKDIFNAYGSCSRKKIISYLGWVDISNKLNATGLSVTSASSYTYSLGFKFKYEDKKYLAYITKDNHYLTEID